MNPRRKKRLGIVLALLAGMAICVGLILYALNQNMDLFYTPSELVNGKADGTKPAVGERLRVGGMVTEGSVQRDPNSLRVSFLLHDLGPNIKVEYDGILPDLFREGQGIVAQGVLKDATTVEAFEVLAKHDENYTPPDIQEAMDKNHQLAAEQQTQGYEQ